VPALQRGMVSPGSAISQGSSLVIPDGDIVRVDVQTVVLNAGAETGMLQMMMSAVVLMEIAVELVIQMEHAVVPAILYQDVDALMITAELVRAMEILVIVARELSTAMEPVLLGYVPAVM
jgi:hypothetical protein